jgi:hypothetical protein
MANVELEGWHWSALPRMDGMHSIKKFDHSLSSRSHSSIDSNAMIGGNAEAFATAGGL